MTTMTIDLTFFAFAIPAVLFAGISKGGFGSGAAFAATAFLAVILEPVVALGLMLPLLLLMDFGGLRPYWRKWDWGAARNLVIGSVPGIVLGALFFRATNPDALRFLIGVVAIAFVAYQGAKARGWTSASSAAASGRGGFLAGVLVGFISFVSHSSGPVVAIYLLRRGLSKTTFQATTVIVFWAVNGMKILPYAALGVFTGDILRAALYLSPFALIGVWAGVWFHRVVSKKLFFLITYVLLLTTGSKLIWDALV